MQVEVVLHVYDLHRSNGYMYAMGLGVYHSGVVVHGREFTFGGHSFDATGVYEHEPGRPIQTIALPMRERTVHGHTTLTLSQVRHLVTSMHNAWKGIDYHLLEKNCNHFTNELLQRLVGRAAPGWVNRLAWLGTSVHCLVPIDRLVGAPLTPAGAAGSASSTSASSSSNASSESVQWQSTRGRSMLDGNDHDFTHAEDDQFSGFDEGFRLTTVETHHHQNSNEQMGDEEKRRLLAQAAQKRIT